MAIDLFDFFHGKAAPDTRVGFFFFAYDYNV